jgi:hypothetical protein
VRWETDSTEVLRPEGERRGTRTDDSRCDRQRPLGRWPSNVEAAAETFGALDDAAPEMPSQRHDGCGRREAVRLRLEGKALKGTNPMSATGMKQGRRVEEGVNRQEGVKS